MNATSVDGNICPRCHRSATADRENCPHCGSSMVAFGQPPQTPGVEPGWKRTLRDVDRPWIVLGLLFFVTAALGLPLLWASRRFSPTAKLVLSVVVTLYTVALLWGFWLVMKWCYTQITDALNTY